VNQRLAYCGIGVADVEAWLRFATEGLGLQQVDREGEVLLKMDEKSWRLAVHEDPLDDILYAGIELDDLTYLRTTMDRLVGSGVACMPLLTEERQKRQVTDGFWLRDPQNLRLEFVTGHATAASDFRSGMVAGFVTEDQGLGHIVFSVNDLKEGITFYESLGFKLSDFITQPIGPDASLRVAFMHCNPRHHTVAMAQLPGGKRLNHLMIELKQVDDVIRGYNRCVAMGYTTGNIGRHPNDEMLSFYVQSPAGFDVEYGWGARHIEGNWAVQEFDQFSLWGHEKTA
jgi:2,3-dihydroxybiphenyl 1,2-dioxygenase